MNKGEVAVWPSASAGQICLIGLKVSAEFNRMSSEGLGKVPGEVVLIVVVVLDHINDQERVLIAVARQKRDWNAVPGFRARDCGEGRTKIRLVYLSHKRRLRSKEEPQVRCPHIQHRCGIDCERVSQHSLICCAEYLRLWHVVVIVVGAKSIRVPIRVPRKELLAGAQAIVGAGDNLIAAAT